MTVPGACHASCAGCRAPPSTPDALTNHAPSCPFLPAFRASGGYIKTHSAKQIATDAASIYDGWRRDGRPGIWPARGTRCRNRSGASGQIGRAVQHGQSGARTSTRQMHGNTRSRGRTKAELPPKVKGPRVTRHTGQEEARLTVMCWAMHRSPDCRWPERAVSLRGRRSRRWSQK